MSSIFLSTGRFATTRHLALRERSSIEIPEMKEGVAAVELDIQTLELRLRGTSLRALDTGIAKNQDMKRLFGTRTGTMQCIVEGSFENMESRLLVGLNYGLEWWTKDDGLHDMYEDYDREYDPNEFGPEEEWIGELFEPVRQAWFVQPVCGENVSFFLPEDCYDASADTAILCGTHPKRGKLWLECHLHKTLRVVHVYFLISHGRRFYRSLMYTSNAQLCLRELQPSIDDREQSWPTVTTKTGTFQWSRHEAFDKAFPQHLRNLTPPAHPRSLVISRPVADPTFAGSADYVAELALVDQLLYPLRQQLAALGEAMTEVGNQVEDKGEVAGPLLEQAEAAFLSLRQTLNTVKGHEYFRDLDDEDEEAVGP